MLASWLYPNLDTPTLVGVLLGGGIGAGVVRAILLRSKRLLRHDRLEHERTRRAPEDVYWGLLRASLALKAQHFYQDRTGLPAFTFRFIGTDGFDEVTRRGDSHLLRYLQVVQDG